MATVTFEVPDEVLAALRLSPDEITREVRLAAAVFWYHRSELSMGMAAKVAGMERIPFMDTLASRKIDTIVLDIEDLKQELARPLPPGVDIAKIKEELNRARPTGS